MVSAMSCTFRRPISKVSDDELYQRVLEIPPMQRFALTAPPRFKFPDDKEFSIYRSQARGTIVINIQDQGDPAFRARVIGFAFFLDVIGQDDVFEEKNN